MPDFEFDSHQIQVHQIYYLHSEQISMLLLLVSGLFWNICNALMCQKKPKNIKNTDPPYSPLRTQPTPKH